MNCKSSFLNFVGIWRSRSSFQYKIVSFCCFYVNSFLSLWKFGLRCEATRFYIDVNMKNTENNRIWLIGCVGLFVSSYSDVEAATEEHPNLLVVMADQFRGDALGFRGKEAVKTPNLDQFAQEAVVLTQAGICCAIAVPTESSNSVAAKIFLNLILLCLLINM